MSRPAWQKWKVGKAGKKKLKMMKHQVSLQAGGMTLSLALWLEWRARRRWSVIGGYATKSRVTKEVMVLLWPSAENQLESQLTVWDSRQSAKRTHIIVEWLYCDHIIVSENMWWKETEKICTILHVTSHYNFFYILNGRIAKDAPSLHKS